jgi:general L-amino acid transport system substrate-binding protein
MRGLAAARHIIHGAVMALLLTGAAMAADKATTLETVKNRGQLLCGVNTGQAGFSAPDSQGKWTGLDVDVCRALAAAVLGDAGKVRYVPLSAQQRLTALQAGEIDILSRNTTWSLVRDTQGLDFGPVVYYDGQGLMVAKSLGVTSAKQLDGATICVQPGTTTELNLADWFRARNLSFKPVVIEALDEVNAAFFSGRCDALSTDVSGLAGVRAAVAPKPDDYVILPEILSKEPLAPAVRHGDNQWRDIVQWLFFALIEAEERGITAANVEEKLKSADPAIQRLLGTQGDMGTALGLDRPWAYRAIRAVGHYGEVFERNVGKASPLRLERGLNALWTNGGLMYAPPIR